MTAKVKKIWHKPGRVRNNHPKGWDKKNVRRYTEAQKWGNVLTFVRRMPKLPMKVLEDRTRQGRRDPRTLPPNEPRCVADWCWTMFNAGTRGALGMGDGQVARLVEANDKGMSGKALRGLILRELLE
jgi:hypothetical protein